MPLAVCNIHTDTTHREITPHGTASFPLGCYNDDLQLMSVPWHWHDEFEFIVMGEGEAIATVDSEKTHLLPGEGLFINSGRLHSVIGTEDAPCRFISVVFHPRLVGGSPDSILWTNYLHPLMNNPLLSHLRLLPKDVSSLSAIRAAESAWKCCTAETPGYEFEARSCLSRMIYHLFCMQPGPASAQASRNHRDSERIKRMLEFIHRHFGEEISTAEIARSAAISESECLRCFHSAIDTTPIQYLRSYRIQRAAELLLSTDMRICDIGTFCGFQEMSYFAKSFREIFGCTPSLYRKRQ